MPATIRKDAPQLTFFTGLNVNQQRLAKNGDNNGIEKELYIRQNLIECCINNEEFKNITDGLINNFRNLVRLVGSENMPTDLSSFDELSSFQQKLLTENDVNFMSLKDSTPEEQELFTLLGKREIKKRIFLLQNKIEYCLSTGEFDQITDETINSFRNLVRFLG